MVSAEEASYDDPDNPRVNWEEGDLKRLFQEAGVRDGGVGDRGADDGAAGRDEATRPLVQPGRGETPDLCTLSAPAARLRLVAAGAGPVRAPAQRAQGALDYGLRAFYRGRPVTGTSDQVAEALFEKPGELLRQQRQQAGDDREHTRGHRAFLQPADPLRAGSGRSAAPPRAEPAARPALRKTPPSRRSIHPRNRACTALRSSRETTFTLRAIEANTRAKLAANRSLGISKSGSSGRAASLEMEPAEKTQAYGQERRQLEDQPLPVAAKTEKCDQPQGGPVQPMGAADHGVRLLLSRERFRLRSFIPELVIVYRYQAGQDAGGRADSPALALARKATFTLSARQRRVISSS